MATVNKDFRVKHGLVVEGTTATVNGSNVLTEGSTEFLQDTAAAVLTGGSHSGISFTYNDETGVVNATVSSTPTFDDKITFEGVTADSFETVLQVTDPTADRTITLPDASGTVALTSDVPTTEDIQDVIGAMVSSNTESGITVTYDDTNGKLDFSVATLDTEAVQDIVGAMVSSNSESGITVTYDDTNGKLDFSVPTQLSTEDIQDIVGGMVSGNSESGIAVTYDDDNGKLDFDVADFTITLGGDLSGSATITNLGNATLTATIAADSVALGTDTSGDYVATIAGTTNQISVSGAGTEGRAVTVSLPSAVVFPGTVTLNADPQNALEAATKQYVDAMTTGLNVHDAVKVATTANIDLSNALENGDVIDGVTLVTGYRVLVKNQSTASQNGIYVVQASGAAVRATDYDAASEIDPGDFFFVELGTANGKTGWVQTNAITTLGTDAVEFTQFSGAGTYTAGNGLSLVGNQFSINTSVTADLSTAQTLSNKTLTSPTISGLYLSDNNIVIEGTADTHETTLTFTDPTADRTITFPDATGTVALLGTIALGTDTTGNYIATIAGTTDQITVTGSGSENAGVTLSLPQSIASTSSPSFAALTLTNAAALTMANSSLADNTFTTSGTSAQVVDSWSASSYTSAKYLVQMKLGNDVEVIEILVTVDGNNNVYLTEYADVYSNTVLGTTDAVYNGGNVELKVTPATTATVVKVHRTLIEA
jgi:hypothetical protein